MSATVTIDGDKQAQLAAHPWRAAVLAEVHARPFLPLETPRRLIHFAFDTSDERAHADRAALSEACVSSGLPAPGPRDKHHLIKLSNVTLRWEQHSEFTTYTWELPAEEGALFTPPAPLLARPMTLLPQPGPVLVAVDLHLVRGDPTVAALEQTFDRSALAVASTGDGAALFATDFKPNAEGFVSILVGNRGLDPAQTGALVQRLLEIETYRTLALLGLPEAQQIAPSIRRIEVRLAELTDEIRRSEGLSANHRLLDELTALAAELEARAAASLFRFGASRAYDELVQLRLQTIGERSVAGLPTWTSFLARRMAPAMRTCATLEERQANLSRKLTRAANLLRTRVDVELEQQNRDLLKSMNARTRLQLRLQATVEGLSVAAITYYVVGLFGYAVKGAHDAGAPIEPTLATAAFVPLALLLIWWMVRRIRRRHVRAEDE